LRQLIDQAQHIHLVQSEQINSAKAELLHEILLLHNYRYASIEKNVTEAVKLAADHSVRNKEILVIAGSFYIMDAAKKALQAHTSKELSTNIM
jgi:folylpolyglutamate synthase/dihydropteroate synthase